MLQRQVYRFSKNRPRLWGHERGKELRSEIEGQLDRLPEGGVLELDLKNVEVMDFSFAGELFGKLYGRHASEYPGRAVILSGLTEYVLVNLQAALSSLGLIALAITGPRKWDLIGKVGDTDRETLDAMAQLQQATAPQVAEKLSIRLTTCNQRLKKLTDAGALLRRRFTATSGGEQFLYQWPL